MAVENGFYEKLVMIRLRGSDAKRVKYKTKKYNFQGQSERTKHLFDLDHETLK